VPELVEISTLAPEEGLRSAMKTKEGKLAEPDSAEEEEASDSNSAVGGIEAEEEEVPDIPISDISASDLD